MKIKKLNEKMLNERYVNLFKREEKEKYLDLVWNMLQKSYEKIGGFKGTEKEELLEDFIMWKLVRRGDKITACSLSKTSSGGRKLIGAGSDGTPEGKKDLYMIMKEDVRVEERQAWGEASEAVEHIYVEHYNAVKIPYDDAVVIMANLGKTISPAKEKKDGYHYIRSIGGEELEKMLIGNIPPALLNKEGNGFTPIQ